MIDVVDPDESFTVADYQRMVKDLIVEINGRGKIPILVGGTGLYYQVVADDYSLFPSQASPEIRTRLEEEAVSIGNHGLHAKLTDLDPEAALKINPNDRKRLARALEAIEITGQAFSSLQTRNPRKYGLASVGLNLPRPYLYKRLDERVDLMIEQGLLRETE
ncbi:MAG: tRNA (adenosine(37)-N6)-dimethylallyltransferase MiaA, partial [Syntrophomonadaceae bacterium]|nr:tRNA (adenosine(37)-N6)-dimethylallyltransferase MiaA [Syntrophomonadaceae bacterium]